MGPILGVCLAVLALKVITKGSPRNDPWGSLHDGKKKSFLCFCLNYTRVLVYHGYIQRRETCERQNVILIQSWYRCLIAWRKYRVMKFSAIRITKMRRASIAKHEYWWVAAPGNTKSRKFEKQAIKIGYAQREGYHSNPSNNHKILRFDSHLFPTNKDRHEHSRLKLRMFLATH